MSQSTNHGCWFEIPVTNLAAARKFYEEVLQVQMTIDENGPQPIAMFPFDDDTPGIGGHLYEGQPGQGGATVHLIAPPGLDAARARIAAAGGRSVSPDIEIPPGTFFYAQDPDGNSFSIFNGRS